MCHAQDKAAHSPPKTSKAHWWGSYLVHTTHRVGESLSPCLFSVSPQPHAASSFCPFPEKEVKVKGCVTSSYQRQTWKSNPTTLASEPLYKSLVLPTNQSEFHENIFSPFSPLPSPLKLHFKLTFQLTESDQIQSLFFYIIISNFIGHVEHLVGKRESTFESQG